MSKQSLGSLLPLFLVIFIDAMGLGLLFPILSSVIIDKNVSFLAKETSLFMRDFLFSFTIAVFMFSWFFGAAFLGDLSDQIGRKRSLIISLLGAALGYWFSAIGILWANITMIIAGRVAAGFTAGSQAIAQAAIVDVSPPEHKSRNLGLILFAASLGFIAGPIMGGLLSNQHILRSFNFATPLYFATLLSLFTAILLYIAFKETATIKRKIEIKLYRPIEIFVAAFKNLKIRQLSLILLIMMYGWSNYYSFISLFLYQRFEYNSTEISLFLSILAMGFGVGCGFLVDYLTKRYRFKSIIVPCFLSTALWSLITLFSFNEIVAWLASFGTGITVGVGYSALLALYSNQVGQDKQGWIMGVSQAVSALSFGLSVFITGFLAHLVPTLPLIIACLGLLISGVLMQMWRENGDKILDNNP